MKILTWLFGNNVTGFSNFETGQFDELFGQNINFAARRDRILRFDAELVTTASRGNHGNLVKLLKSLLAEVNITNSNVSRYIVTPIKSAYPNTSKSELAQTVYLEHNRAYIEIRRLCKELIDSAPLLASSEGADDFMLLDDAQSAEVFDSLGKINDAVRSLELVWKRLQRFEDESLKLRKETHSMLDGAPSR